MAYMIFLIIGITGYFTVPSIANYIVHAGGSNSLLHRVTTGFTSASRSVSSSTSSAAGSMVKDMYGDAKNIMQSGFRSEGGDFFKDKLSGKL